MTDAASLDVIHQGPPLPVPGPVVSGLGDQLGQSVLDQFTRWIGDAAQAVTDQIISFLANTTGVDLLGAFTGSSSAAAIFHRVVALAGVLMVGFVFLPSCRVWSAGSQR